MTIGMIGGHRKIKQRFSDLYMSNERQDGVVV